MAHPPPADERTPRRPHPITTPWVIDGSTWDHIADAIRHASRTGLLPGCRAHREPDSLGA